MSNYDVAVIIGSQTDLTEVRPTLDLLKQFGIRAKTKILSAHRTPKELSIFCESVEDRGIKVIISAAGWSAALPATIASQVNIPVIGIPIASSPLGGLDSILSILQMPRGAPVGTMSINPAGAKNAAIFAAQILALSNEEISGRLREFKEKEHNTIIEANQRISKTLKKPVISNGFNNNHPYHGYCGI